MDKIYSTEDIIERINNEMSSEKARFDAWNAIKRVHKTDGTDFKDVRRNFTGCKFIEYYDYNRHENTYNIVIYYHDAVYGYTSDELFTASFAGELSDVEYNSADYFERIIFIYKKHINDNINDLFKQYAECEDVAGEFYNSIRTALNTMKEKAGDRSTLYYACLDLMHDLY